MEPDTAHDSQLGKKKLSRREDNLRRVREFARSGAPTAGEAVGDVFSADEIFERIVATADAEFSRSWRLLFLSGLAAGLVMCLSFLGQASVAGELGPDPSRLLTSLLYPIGFVFVVLGGYQLFTENTLTPVALVLTRIASLRQLVQIWGVVFFANILGTAIGAFGLARTSILDPEVMEAARVLGHHMFSMEGGTLFAKGVVAGWLVAGMVWLNHAARSATGRLLIIFLMMYTVSAADLAHCIVGSSEGLFLLFRGEVSFKAYAWDMMVPTTAGNVAGGVLLVAIFNYALTKKDEFPEAKRLTWKEWLMGRRD